MAALLLVALLLPACGPRYRRTVVQEEGGITVTVRSLAGDDGMAPRGFNHPATISGIRLAHILSRIDVRLSAGADDGAGDRRPAVPTELIYPLGDALSAGLAAAGENQEVVVEAIRKERRLGIFTNERVTSLVAWVQGDELVVHVGRSDDLIPKGELDDLKEPIPGRQVQAFKVVATEGIVPVADQAVSVHWRDPVFREASHIRVGPTGEVMRRTILMEAPPEAAEEELPPLRLPSDPETLRELAELEEQRRAGEISEAEYHRRRDALLRSGAGPGEEPR
ncbi:MAG: SHOCT domain-containing protein [Myxococcota bacterium]|nr:SHOCT domain-containing protein [Myxococcota bacterium]